MYSGKAATEPSRLIALPQDAWGSFFCKNMIKGEIARQSSRASHCLQLLFLAQHPEAVGLAGRQYCSLVSKLFIFKERRGVTLRVLHRTGIK